MKKLLILPFLFVFSSFFAQGSIDFDDINKKVQDSTGQYFYEKLKYKLGYLPTALDSLESKYLYYGQFSLVNSKENKIVPIGDFLELTRKRKYKEAIAEGEKILKQEPVNLEVLGRLVQLYETSDKDNSLFPLRITQFKLLLDTIISNYMIKDDNKIYVVMSVADEYIIGGILDYNLYAMRRKSEHISEGIVDHWKQGKKKISFLVFYPKDKN